MMTILNILGMQDDPHGKGICSLWEAFTNLFAVDTPHYHTAISWREGLFWPSAHCAARGPESTLCVTC